MTVITPDPTRSRRLVATHAFSTPVVRELPSQLKPGQALGSTWVIPPSP
jgi:hypothetical protein